MTNQVNRHLLQQAQKVIQILGVETEEKTFMLDIAQMVQTYVSQSNRTIMDLHKEVARLQAELEKCTKEKEVFANELKKYSPTD